jgi:hypothetical protein
LGFNVTEVIDEVLEFDLEDFNVPIEIKQYVPFLDVTGPYLFYPTQCYGNEKFNIYDSPVIAYIRTNSSVETAVVQSLDSLFETQRSVAAGGDVLSILTMFATFGTSFIQVAGLAEGANEIQGIASSYGINATDIDSADIDAFGDGQSKTDLTPGNFTLVPFDTQEELDEYIAHPEMGFNAERPAVCYAFKIHEDEKKQKYELELFFNDMWIR